MGYIHVEIVTSQLSKKKDKPCGDFVTVERNKNSTIHIVCDGLGSGIKANIAANMCASRIRNLILSGFTVRQAFSSVVQTMEDARTKELPYSVFTIIRVLNDGITTVLSYEMPPPIFLSRREAVVIDQRFISDSTFIAAEANCFLKPEEALIVVSDGITYSGIGKGIKNGWGTEGLTRYINHLLKEGVPFKKLPEEILDEAKLNWHGKIEDDCTVSLVKCRKGKVINLFTGPPLRKDDDPIVVDKFLSLKGVKIVCGATTAKIVARHLGQELSVYENYQSTIAPPSYEIDGIDLVTEGVITLNQVYNVWDEDSSKLEKFSPVTDLFSLLYVADRVNIFHGQSDNPADGDISFIQTRVLSRKIIIPLLAEKLRDEGKLVVIEQF